MKKWNQLHLNDFIFFNLYEKHIEYRLPILQAVGMLEKIAEQDEVKKKFGVLKKKNKH